MLLENINSFISQKTFFFPFGSLWHHTHEKQQILHPLINGGGGGSYLCNNACFTSSASVSSQIILFAMVCHLAVFHYPVHVSVPPPSLRQDWPPLNMPRHHLQLNGLLWSKCQRRKLLKKKFSHLLSWHFQPRLIPPLLAFTPLLPPFLLPQASHSRILNKRPCSSLI